MNSLGGAFNKLTGGWNSHATQDSGQSEDFYPAKPPLGNKNFSCGIFNAIEYDFVVLTSRIIFNVFLSSDDAEFRLFLGDDGKLTNPEGLRLRVYNGGVAPALRKVIWRLLLNIFPDDLSGQERIDYIKKKSG